MSEPDFEEMVREVLQEWHGIDHILLQKDLVIKLRSAHFAGRVAGLREASKIADHFEELKWRTLQDGGTLAGCSPRNIAEAIRFQSSRLEQYGQHDDGFCAKCGSWKQCACVEQKAKGKG